MINTLNSVCDNSDCCSSYSWPASLEDREYSLATEFIILVLPLLQVHDPFPHAHVQLLQKVFRHRKRLKRGYVIMISQLQRSYLQIRIFISQLHRASYRASHRASYDEKRAAAAARALHFWDLG